MRTMRQNGIFEQKMATRVIGNLVTIFSAEIINGAAQRARTADRLITNQVLYQLTRRALFYNSLSLNTLSFEHLIIRNVCVYKLISSNLLS